MLLEAGTTLTVLDRYAKSSPQSLERVRELVGPAAAERLTVLEGDIRQPRDLERAFATPAGEPIAAVIHFAGLKAVEESVAQPLIYWDVNVGGSRQLLEAMQCHGCRTPVFSSSATVYGIPAADWGKTPSASPITFSPWCVRWRWGGDPSCRCMAMTGPPPTAAACGTPST